MESVCNERDGDDMTDDDDDEGEELIDKVDVDRTRSGRERLERGWEVRTSC